MKLDKSSISALAFAGIGLLVLIIGVFLYYRDTSVLSSWKPTKGEVTSSQVIQMPTAGTGRSFTAKVNYTYTYEGKSYSSSCCDVGSADLDRWNSIVEKNPAGSQADILLDPADPSNSLLKDSIQPLNVFVLALIIGGGIFFILGLISFYLTLTA